mgnify:CR=1 FL=1
MGETKISDGEFDENDICRFFEGFEFITVEEVIGMAAGFDVGLVEFLLELFLGFTADLCSVYSDFLT